MCVCVCVCVCVLSLYSRVIVQHSKVIVTVTKERIGPARVVNVVNSACNEDGCNVTLFNAVLYASSACSGEETYIVITATLEDNCCVERLRRKDNKRSQQSPMEGATSKDLKGNLSKQAMIDVVTVRRPLKQGGTAKKVAPPGIEPRTPGFSCQCSSKWLPSGRCSSVVIDAHSKWIEVWPVHAATSSATIVKLRPLFAQFGLIA